MIPLLLLLAAPIVPEGTAFRCEVSAVHDGDTWTCSDGTRVRAAGIDAPELGACRGRPGRICVPGDGIASREALAGIIKGATLRCTPSGTSYRRIVAWCGSPRVPDLSCAMVQAGYAVRWDRYWRGHRCGEHGIGGR